MKARWAIAWGMLAGCGSPSTPQSDPSAPTRFVSLSPAITETIGWLGAQDRLVGRSDWCRLPAEVEALPSFGSGLSPRLEGLAGVQPATVLVDGSLGVDVADLRAVAPLEVLPWLTGDEVLSSVARLGVLVDASEEAAKLVTQLRGVLKPPPAADDEVPRVLLAMGGPETGEVWYIKRNSVHGALLHGVGVRNAVDRDVAGAPVLSLEALLSLDPDAIVVLSPEASTHEAARAPWASLTPLRAVQRGHIWAVGGPHAMSPGPSMLKLAAELRDVLGALSTPSEPRRE